MGILIIIQTYSRELKQELMDLHLWLFSHVLLSCCLEMNFPISIRLNTGSGTVDRCYKKQVPRSNKFGKTQVKLDRFSYHSTFRIFHILVYKGTQNAQIWLNYYIF